MMSRTREMHPLMKISVLSVGAALLVWGLLFAYLSGPAWAATITVNSTDDPGADDEQCTLREAITSANNDAAFGGCEAGFGDDVINIGATGTVDLTAVLPDLSTNIEIVGPGADQLTVRRPDSEDTQEDFYRIFTVTGDTTEVAISGMTVSNGNTVGTDPSRGGGIFNNVGGTLTITDSTISGNTAQDAGAIRNDGTLEVSDSTLSGNTSNSEAGAIQNVGALEVSNSTFSGNSADGGSGGGILNQCTIDPEVVNCIEGTGTATVTDSTFSRNSAGSRGGAIANSSSGTATVSGSTFSGNSAGGEGGGISNQRELEVSDSTISGNSASNGGGGILNESAITPTVTDSTISGNTASGGDGGGGILTRGALTVTDSTISGNTASGGGDSRGGGIFSNTSGSQTTTITNSTISGNTAQNGGGGVHNNAGLTAIEHSTVTDNTAPDGQGSGVASDGTGTEVLSSIISANANTDVDFVNEPTNSFVSRGYNLIGDGNAIGDDDPSTDDNAFDQTGDQVIGDDTPGLGPLSDNGGPTETHALLAGSPAVDAGPPTDGDPTACPPPDTDQRGVPRPQDGDGDGTARCDTGSFELEPVDPEACTITGTRGDDVLTGTPEDDVICGRQGEDTIRGLGGNDTLLGGKGSDADVIRGNSGDDTLLGGNARDSLIGGDGADELRGQFGRDALDATDGVGGNDEARGGPDTDSCSADAGDEVVGCEN